MLQNRLIQTLTNVEELLEEQRAEAFFQEAWEPQAAAAEEAAAEEAAASASAAASGRIDGSEHSLQSGAGNLPLKQKLELAYALGSFKQYSELHGQFWQKSFIETAWNSLGRLSFEEAPCSLNISSLLKQQLGTLPASMMQLQL